LSISAVFHIPPWEQYRLTVQELEAACRHIDPNLGKMRG